MRILVVSKLNMHDWPDSREAEKLREWFNARHQVEHTSDATECGPAFDLAFLVGREIQRKYKTINRPFWLRKDVAGIPHPRVNIKPELERMTKSFIQSVIALFECAPDRPLDAPKGLRDANV